jgi:PadR family transcriptional regulator PadR
LANHLLTKYEDNPLSASLAMGRSYLGEFEELVSLTVASMKGEAYGAAITHVIQQKTGRMVVLSAVHVALYRLEEKGLVTSSIGGATQERGGRRKRLFRITAYGVPILAEMRQAREELWQLIPQNIKPSLHEKGTATTQLDRSNLRVATSSRTVRGSTRR